MVNKTVLSVFLGVQKFLYHFLHAFTIDRSSSRHLRNLFDTFVEETFTSHLWLMDALGHSSPLVITVVFTVVTGDIYEFSSEEMTVLFIFIHIDCFSNLASGELLF